MSKTREETLKNRDQIYQWYCVEGKSLNSISKILCVSRKQMTSIIKNELGFIQAKIPQPTKRVVGLIGKYKDIILDYCNFTKERELPCLLDKYGISRSELRSMCRNDKDIKNAVSTFTNKTSLKELNKRDREAREDKWREESFDLEGEVWKEVGGFEGLYWVSNLGRIKNKVKLIKTHLNKHMGRREVRLYKDGRGFQFKVYRLIAINFLDNPDNKPTVNHIDGDYTNDVLSNLEWSSYKEQNYHKNYILKRPIAVAYKKNGKFKKVIVDGEHEFNTLREVSVFLGKSETTIQRYLSGSSKCKHTIELIYQ